MYADAHKHPQTELHKFVDIGPITRSSRDFTCCSHSSIVASQHPWLSMHHLLAVECAPTLAAMMNVGMMIAQLFQSPREVGPQDHPFPEEGNLHTAVQLSF